MSSRSPFGDVPERRSSGLLRIPFVRRCVMELDDGTAETAMIVNINVLGAYVASDASPRLGQPLRLRFGVPGNARELSVCGSVAWINRQQQHPVHSLPPGFGVRFTDLDGETRRRIETLVIAYVRRQGAR